MKVHIIPRFAGEDEGDGGIRRVVEAQHRWLPHYGIEVVDDMGQADLIASHAGVTGNLPQAMPWVVHTHGLYWQEYGWPRWCLDVNRDVIDAMRRADHVTAPSDWVAQVLRRGMWLRPSVLYHGVDMEDWQPVDAPSDFVLWNKNRPDPVCDPRPVITLAQQLPDVRFVSTFGQDLPNLRITGRIPYATMKELVRHAGVYLCTTRETFGIGTLEAMAAGVPVVGWAWGGQREIIRHGETGWLCPPGDTEGLEEGIRWALANRGQIADAQRQDVLLRWTWETAISSYAQVYEAVYASKADRFSGPRVSVVIPCYNLGRYLPDAIKSLQAQTSGDWEAIIVNDASPDDTAKAAELLADVDSRVRVITNDRNLYLAGALNAGIAAARGRYIVNLDADNMLDPATLEVLSSALDADRGIHIAYGAARFVLEDGVKPDPSVAVDGVSGWPTEFSFKGQMLHRNQIPSTCMYRREVWERSGGYRRRCRTAEDAENWTRVTSLGFVAEKVTSRPTLIYRQREDSMSRVEPDWDWTGWFPWSRRFAVVPFGVHEKPPSSINEGISWPVPSYEPVKVSVVIPVGPGHQELFIDALDSVEAQTYRSWECIVVNDTGQQLKVPHPWAKVLEGGVDATTDTAYHPFRVDELARKSPSFCSTCGETESWHQRMGPGRARNLGIAASIAPVFVALDADDYLQPEALERMLAVWEDVGGVVYSQWFDDKGNITEIYDPPEYDAQLLVTGGSIHAVTAMYPKAAWEEVGGFDEDLSHWEDWDYQLRMASIGVCGSKIPLPLFTYRKMTGTRREANVAAFDEGRNAILAKWSRFWDGRETLMACSGCGGGGGARYPAPPTMAAQAANGGAAGVANMKPREGYVVLKYNGQSTSTRQYKGPKSGVSYRFGNNAQHQMSYVYEEDLPHFESLSEGSGPLFTLIASASREPPASPVLAATGPPQAPAAAAGAIATLDVPATTTGPELLDDILQRATPAAPGGPVAPSPRAARAVPAQPEDMPVMLVEEVPFQELPVSEIRKNVATWPIETVALYLAHEKARDEPRGTAVAALQKRLQGDEGDSEWKAFS